MTMYFVSSHGRQNCRSTCFFQTTVKKIYFLGVRISDFTCTHGMVFGIPTDEQDDQSC